MEKPVRIALVGAGLVGKRHISSIEQSNQGKLGAIVDPQAGAQELAQNLQVPYFKTLEELLISRQIDGVILATPNQLHVSQALACIAAGYPTLVEKPIATSALEAQQIVDAAESKQVPILVGHHRRHNPLIQKAYELIQNNEIGDVRAVQATCWVHKPEHYFDEAPWRKKTGAGPISVNLIHDVDLIRYLCGDVVSIQAQSAPSMRGYENEDVAAAVLCFENGAIGTISVSDTIVSPWSWELTAQENPAYPPTQQSCYQIGGSLGSLSVPDLTPVSYTHLTLPTNREV